MYYMQEIPITELIIQRLGTMKLNVAITLSTQT